MLHTSKLNQREMNVLIFGKSSFYVKILSYTMIHAGFKPSQTEQNKNVCWDFSVYEVFVCLLHTQQTASNISLPQQWILPDTGEC